MLKSLGHQVSGYSLDPLAGGVFELCDIAQDMNFDFRRNINNLEQLQDAFNQIKPEVVFHLAAQPLVRESYINPRETFETNVMGTLNVLEATSKSESVLALVVITTDKVYKNVEQNEGYVESDPLGGDDPYSSSKAMADLLTQSWVKSFHNVPTAIMRGGNVIGGGDVSRERLLVDLISAFKQDQAPMLRFPNAVRPWQHVLDCLSGYIDAMNYLISQKTSLGIWNIGPGPESFVSVGELTTTASEIWGNNLLWSAADGENPHEAGLLALDSTRAKNDLNWSNLLPFPLCLEWTLDWELQVQNGKSPREITLGQLQDYEQLMVSRNNV